MAEKYISVGKLGKPHGLSGAFRFMLNNKLKNKKKQPLHFTVESNGSYLPWFVKEIQWSSDTDGFVFFEEISTPEEAKKLSGMGLFLAEKDFKLLFSSKIEIIDNQIGYEAIDIKNGKIGTISGMVKNQSQLLCEVKTAKDEIFIPFIDKFILEIDKRKKQVIFKLPEGLLNL